MPLLASASSTLPTPKPSFYVVSTCLRLWYSADSNPQPSHSRVLGSSTPPRSRSLLNTWQLGSADQTWPAAFVPMNVHCHRSPPFDSLQDAASTLLLVKTPLFQKTLGKMKVQASCYSLPGLTLTAMFSLLLERVLLRASFVRKLFEIEKLKRQDCKEASGSGRP